MTSLDAEANSNVQYTRWHFSEGWLYEVEKPKHTQTPRSATTRHVQTMTIEVREGQAAAARQMSQGAAISSQITAVLCVCARGGQICGLTSRQHLESGRNTLFGGFSDLGNGQKRHSSPHAVYTDLTVGESCIDQDLWPTSGYHKHWPIKPKISKYSYKYDKRRSQQ